MSEEISSKTKPCNESLATQLNAFPRSPSKYQIASSHSNKSSAENMCAQHRREFVRSLSLLAKFINRKNVPIEERRERLNACEEGSEMVHGDDNMKYDEENS